jgi:hypothetical protein
MAMTSRVLLWPGLLLAFGLAACGGDSKKEDTTPPAVVDPMAGWTSLGQRTLDGKLDRDSVLVSGSDRFRVLQIKVDGAMDMSEIIIHFDDGTTFSPPTRMIFDNDTSSRIVDLPGGNRGITRVEFRYGGLQAGMARVELWGR